MARSSSEIDTIIAGLKTARDTRDAAIETAAAALDSSDTKNAARLRSLTHSKEKALDLTICIHDKIKKDSDGNVAFMYHDRHILADHVENGETPTTVPGLRTRLVDESFTVTGSTTVEDL